MLTVYFLNQNKIYIYRHELKNWKTRRVMKIANKKIFTNYFNHLVEYQNQLLPDNKLSRDYIILYDYLMDLLEEDDIVGALLVRKKLDMSNINADILLDLTRVFDDIRSYIQEPYLRLTLTSRCNESFSNFVHPFCNEKLSIVPQNIKKAIWLALHKGLLSRGSFVRGYLGDIYEMNLSSTDHSENCIRLNATSDNIKLSINLRILINYTRNTDGESSIPKSYSANELNSQWLAALSRHFHSPFEVCQPKLEHEIKQMCFNLVMIMRLLRFLFKKNSKLSLLDAGFIESIIYNEYFDLRVSKKASRRYDYIFKCVLTRIFKALKTKKCPCFWNDRLNLIKSIDRNSLLSNAFQDFNILYNNLKSLRNKDSLKYEDFFEFFDFRMDLFSYEVDQFGIFKSY